MKRLDHIYSWILTIMVLLHGAIPFIFTIDIRIKYKIGYSFTLATSILIAGLFVLAFAFIAGKTQSIFVKTTTFLLALILPFIYHFSLFPFKGEILRTVIN